MNEESKTILVIGATGFLGSYIVRELLSRGQRIVALLRSPLSESQPRLFRLLKQIGVPVSAVVESDQLVTAEGSLPDELPAPTWGHTDAVLNCAASLQLFMNRVGNPFKTNVGGTEAIIRWVEEHGVHQIHAVSTAYTCGWNNGVIYERFHTPKPEFQTDYERSKWTAESLLCDWAAKPDRQLTVYRPSFLVGDSRTGYTSQFGGFYQLTRLVSVLRDRFCDPNNGERTYIPLRIPGRPEDPQNIVPVDFVGQMVGEIVTQPQFHGRVYHLTNPTPPTNDLVKSCYEDYFKMYGGYFAKPNEVVGKCSSAESLLWDDYHLLTPRVVHNPQFDVSHTLEVMQARGIEFPILNKERIFRLFDYASRCGYGKGLDGFHD